MFGDARVLVALPVKDVQEARSFYEGTLCLTFVGGPRADGSFEYECGAGTYLFTYPTEDNAGKSPATLAAWHVADIRATATELRQKGIVLEEYDLPGLRTDDGIASLPGARAAWFKDPDGNILSCFDRD